MYTSLSTHQTPSALSTPILHRLNKLINMRCDFLLMQRKITALARELDIAIRIEIIDAMVTHCRVCSELFFIKMSYIAHITMYGVYSTPTDTTIFVAMEVRCWSTWLNMLTSFARCLLRLIAITVKK